MVIDGVKTAFAILGLMACFICIPATIRYENTVIPGLQEEKAELGTKVQSLTVENTALKQRNALLEAQLRSQPQPTSYPTNCPFHSEMGQEADGSWQVICIDAWSDYGAKSVSIRRSTPEVPGGWTQREELIIRATITEPPMDP